MSKPTDGAKLIAYAATDETATPDNHRRVYEAMSRWYAAVPHSE